MLHQVFLNMDVAKAKATVQTDLLRILDDIRHVVMQAA